MVMMTMVTKTKDIDRVMKLAGEVGAGILAEVLGVEAERVIVLGQRFVPRETHSLMASGWTGAPTGEKWYRKASASGYKIGVHRFTIRFGWGTPAYPNSKTGVATSIYAGIQNQRTDFRHPRGGQAHFLEAAIAANQNGMEGRMMQLATAIWNRVVK